MQVLTAPLVFNVEKGTYNEQLVLGPIDGSSAINQVTFKGIENYRDSVVLRFAPTNTNNYVINIDGAEFVNFEWMTLLGRGTGNYSNVVSIVNSRQLHFKNAEVRVKGGLNNINASGIIVGPGVNALYIENSILDSGYYAVRSTVTDPGATEGVYITNNTIRNFMFMGVYLRKVNDVYIVNNHIITGAASNGKPLTGIFVAQHDGPATIERNFISIYDNFTGAKTGIKVVNVVGSNATRTHIHNNMCAIYGNTNGTSSGISIDSSNWVNAYFNSCQVYAGTGSQGQNTKAMYVGTTSSDIYIMNNIFSNISAGYAYYVQLAANVANSHYNDYYSSAEHRLAIL